MALSDVGVRLVAESEQAFISALDNAAGAVKNLAEQGAAGFGFSDALTQADSLTTAIGVGLYDAIKGVVGQIVDMGKEAFNTIADFERTTQSIEAMMAIEISMGTTVTDTTDAVYSLTDAELINADKFAAAASSKDMAILGIQASLKKLDEAQAKDPNLSVVAERNNLLLKMKVAQNEAAAAAAKHSDLLGKQGMEFEVQTKRQINQVDDINEAMRLAKRPAEEMLDQLTRMALASPFERKPILDVMKQGQAFGFTAKESMKATDAYIKFATVTGRNEGHITRLGYAMGQMKSQGKVMTRQLRQMNMAGLGMNQMAEAMGMSIEEFTGKVSKGQVPFDEFNDKLMAFINRKYTPAFQEINESFFGLQNAIQDINKLSLAAFFEGTMEAGKGILVEFVRPFTQGNAMAAIQGFGDKIGEALAPGLKVAADKTRDLMQGFMDLSDMINGPVDKSTKNLIEEEKESTVIIKDLGKALDDSEKKGVSVSNSYAKLSANFQWTNTYGKQLTDTLVAQNAASKSADGTVADLTSSIKLQDDELAKLAKSGQRGTQTYNDLMKANLASEDALKKAKIAQTDATTAVVDSTKKQTDNTAAQAKAKEELNKLGTAAQNMSPRYASLLAQKEALAAKGKQEGDIYKGIVAEMKVMEDGTVSYVDTTEALNTTTLYAEDVRKKLKEVEDQTAAAAAASGKKVPETFMGKIIASFDEFIDKNGPVAAILLSLEDIFFKLKKKAEDAWKEVKTFFGGMENSGLWSVNDALKSLRDNFDRIWAIGKNVVTVVVGLAFLKRIAGFAMAAAKAFGFFLTPLGLIVGATAILTNEYEKGNEGVVKFADTHKKSFDDWYKNASAMFSNTTKEGVVFRENLGVMKEGIRTILNSEFITEGTTVENAIKEMRRIDGEGFESVRKGISDTAIQFGILPSTADTIAKLLVAPVEAINAVWGTVKAAFKLGVIDEIVNLWKSDPGSVEAYAFQTRLQNILKKLLPEGWAKAIETGVVIAVGVMDTFKKAIDFVETAFKNVKTAMEPFIKFLQTNSEAIVPVIIAVGQITAAVWLLNAALVAATGVNLGSLATGIAPAAADAGTVANMQSLRGGLGMTAVDAGAQAGATGLSAFLAGADPKALAAAKTGLEGVTEKAGHLRDVVANLEGKKLAGFFDEKGFATGLAMLGQTKDTMHTMSTESLTSLKAAFTTSFSGTELLKLDGEIIAAKESLALAASGVDDWGKKVVAQEAIQGNVFNRLATKAKGSFASISDDIAAMGSKLGGMGSKISETVGYGGMLQGVTAGSLPQPKLLSSPALPSMLDTVQANADETARLFQLERVAAFAKAAEDDVGLHRAKGLRKHLYDSNKANKDSLAADLADFMTQNGITEKTAKTKHKGLLDFFKAENTKYYTDKAKEAFDIETGSLQKSAAAKALGAMDSTKGKHTSMLGAAFGDTKIGEAFTQSGEKIKGTLKSVFSYSDEAASGVGMSWQKGAKSLSGNFGTYIGNPLTTGFKSLTGPITSGMGSIWTAVSGQFAGGISALGPNLLKMGGGLGGFLKTGLMAGIKGFVPMMGTLFSGGMSMITGLFTGGIGGITTLFTGLFSGISSLFGGVLTLLSGSLGFIGTALSTIFSPVIGPIIFIALAIVAIVWGLYNDVGGIWTSLKALLMTLLIPLYMIWNTLLALWGVVVEVFWSIWERIQDIWETGLKPVFTMFAGAIAILIDWVLWFIYPWILVYGIIFKVIVPLLAIILYGAFMYVWFVIEIVIQIVLFIIKVFFGLVQAIYSVVLLFIEMIKWVWEAVGAGEFFRDLWKKLMDKIGGAQTSSAFTTIIEWLTYFYNKVQAVVDIVKFLIKNFMILGEFAMYDWVGYYAAKGLGTLDAFEAKKGKAPSFDLDISDDWTPEVTVKQMTAAVNQVWDDLTGDTVREPGADASALEKVWLMATNLMKSPEAKAEPDNKRKEMDAKDKAKENRELEKAENFDAKKLEQQNAARKQEQNARVGKAVAPQKKGAQAFKIPGMSREQVDDNSGGWKPVTQGSSSITTIASTLVTVAAPKATPVQIGAAVAGGVNQVLGHSSERAGSTTFSDRGASTVSNTGLAPIEVVNYN